MSSAAAIARAALLAVLALALVVAAPRAEARHEKGTSISVTGLVTDTDGTPLSNVRVVLEASREVFSFRQLGPVLRDTTKVAAVTDARGEFKLSWPWDSFYNHFEVAVGVPVRDGREERLEVLTRSEITRRMARNEKVVVPLVVDNAEFVRKLRAFLAGIDTDDERRVYQQMGTPDRIEERGSEVKWFYFERGRMFRFESGRLTETKAFTPVPGP